MGSLWGWIWVIIILLYVISVNTDLASPHLPSEKRTADACEDRQILPRGATPLVMLDQERGAALQESIKPVASPECSSSGAATPDPSYQNLISRNFSIFRRIPRTPVLSQRGKILFDMGVFVLDVLASQNLRTQGDPTGDTFLYTCTSHKIPPA